MSAYELPITFTTLDPSALLFGLVFARFSLRRRHSPHMPQPNDETPASLAHHCNGVESDTKLSTNSIVIAATITATVKMHRYYKQNDIEVPQTVIIRPKTVAIVQQPVLETA